MRESDTPIESPLGGYRAIMREVATLRAEVQRLRGRVTAMLVATVAMIGAIAAAVWLGR